MTDTQTNQSHDAHIQKLGELIHGIKIAMLTTMDDSGLHRSRPMAVQQVEFDGDLWFFTSKSSSVINEVRSHQSVNVSLADPGKNTYISVSGNAESVEDRAKAEELWTPAYKAWFPEGLDDPNLILLKVDVEQAEYWDAPSGPVVHMIGFVKAIATGKAYNYEGAENEKLDLADLK